MLARRAGDIGQQLRDDHHLHRMRQHRAGGDARTHPRKGHPPGLAMQQPDRQIILDGADDRRYDDHIELGVKP